MPKRTLLLLIGILTSPYLLSDQEGDDYCSSNARTQRLTAKHREANGIGYSTGYSTIEGFFSMSRTPNLIGFADIRAHIFNDSKKAYNAGIGLRALSQSANAVFGMNVFYDYRDSRHRDFSQIGVGLEVLGRRWDLRANSYIPVHHTKKKYSDGFLHFKANSAIFAKKYEFAFIGCELALGKELFSMKNWDMRAKLAGYWFHGDFGKNAGGGLFELSTNITRYVTLKGQVSYDTLFREIFQGEAAVNVPLGWRFNEIETSLSCKALAELEKRLVESVDRFEIIVTSTKRKKTPALDPLTGQPLTFFFVNNTSHSAGTFESPFPTLQQAQAASGPNHVIYVFPGDGSSNGLNKGIILKNNQSLIGSAAPFTVTTRFGVRTIPAQTLNTPLLTNTSTNVVTLANNNTVAGLTILSPNSASSAIFGNGIIGLKANFNTLSQGDNTVNLNNFTGNLEVQENTFIGTGTGLNITASGNATGTVNYNNFNCTGQPGSLLGACNYTATAGTQVFTFDSNRFVPPSGDPNSPFVGQQGINFLTSNSSNVIINITNSYFINFIGGGAGNGIAILSLDNSICQTLISKNTIVNSGNSAIFLEGQSNSVLAADLESNLAINADIGGAGFSGVTIVTGIPTNLAMIIRAVDNAIFTASPSSPALTFFTASNCAFFVQSPNGLLSGVQELNVGSVTVNTSSGGQVIFVPLMSGPPF